ncbi:MAG: ABC transporter ATP-binding protein [Paracoccaceae bacterium]
MAKKQKKKQSPAGEAGSFLTAYRLVREALPSRWKLYALSLLCMVSVAVFTALLAYSTKLIVNDVFSEGQASKAYLVALLVVGVSIGKGVAGYANSIVAMMFSRSITTEYMRRVFAKFMGNEVPFFAGQHAAQHMARIVLYGRASGSVVTDITNRMLTDTLTLIGLVAVMIFQDPFMSLFGAILFPLVLLLVNHLTRRVREISSAEAEIQGAMHGVGTEAIEGIKTVKSYGLEEKSISKFEEAVQALETRLLKISRASSLTMPLMEIIGGVTIGLFVIYASWQTLEQGRSPGEFTAFITAFLLAYQPGERISKSVVTMQRQLFHVEAMYRMLDEPEPSHEGELEVLTGATSELEFQDVSFKYKRSSPVLKSISFKAKAGERIAIVGPSGAGKTTLIDLVQGFYPPSSGRILIGGKSVSSIAKEQLRANIALISQDVFLFNGSIRENIADGNPNATPEQVEAAAERAAVTGFAAAMEHGLDTSVGPNGAALSGGQKQRVGIARALVKDAMIYIFDEATSALDGDNERMIMGSAIDYANDSTVLFVTHRPSTLKWVDRVLYLNDGELVAFTTHDKLVETNEAYRSLFNMHSEEDLERLAVQDAETL